MIIAVDGPSAAGKGTLARAIAKHYGYHYLDTGTLYRMVGLMMIRTHTDFSNHAVAAGFASTLDPTVFLDNELRGEVVGAAASKVAIIPEVRGALLKFQQDFAKRAPGAVLDGRDLGTVICPEADVKLFITASSHARAERRFKEFAGNSSFENIKADIEARDTRDATRSHAPTRAAPDAITIDTSNMSIEEALTQALAIISQRQTV